MAVVPPPWKSYQSASVVKRFWGSGLEFRSFREAQIALRQRQREQLFDLGFFAIARHGDFADQQIAGALEHFLFAEGKRLGLVQRDQVLQHSGDFEQGAGAHAVGILFEAVFPVGVAVAVGKGEKVQNLLHFAVSNHPANAYAAHVVAGHHNLQAAGFDIKKIELLNGRPDRTAADLFDNPHPVVGIDDLIADVKIQVRTTHKGTRAGTQGR